LQEEERARQDHKSHFNLNRSSFCCGEDHSRLSLGHRWADHWLSSIRRELVQHVEVERLVGRLNAIRGRLADLADEVQEVFVMS
jgi:hypothetical protein